MIALGDQIIRILRLDQPDPTADWREHIRQIRARCDHLNASRFDALHLRGPGTNLTIGLPAGHLWMGGTLSAANGITFIPNMPTEEIFTLPHRDRVDGIVHSTMPLSYAGQLIEDFDLTFQEGQVVESHARKGENLLHHMLAVDEGARRLGEVALVPASSPVARSGRLFYNTLFDENAACHLAVGSALHFSLASGAQMSDEAFAAAGGNLSMTHVDFMVGSDKLDVDGLFEDGRTAPLMRAGEWTFTV